MLRIPGPPPPPGYPVVKVPMATSVGIPSLLERDKVATKPPVPTTAPMVPTPPGAPTKSTTQPIKPAPQAFVVVTPTVPIPSKTTTPPQVHNSSRKKTAAQPTQHVPHAPSSPIPVISSSQLVIQPVKSQQQLSTPVPPKPAQNVNSPTQPTGPIPPTKITTQPANLTNQNSQTDLQKIAIKTESQPATWPANLPPNISPSQAGFVAEYYPQPYQMIWVCLRAIHKQS